MILEVNCPNEGGGPATHTIKLLDLDLESLHKLWLISKKYSTLFGIAASNDFGTFCSIFVNKDRTGYYNGNGLVWVIDDYAGIFYMTDIYCPDDAMVHFSFFDGRMRGREPLVKEMLKYVFSTFGFRRLSAQIPLYALPKGYKRLSDAGKSPTEFGAFGFTKACGFKQEGRKRACSEYKGQYFDVICYGILKEEVLGNGE